MHILNIKLQSRKVLHNFQLFINNEFVESVSGKRFEVINPATGDLICDVAEADKVSYLISWKKKALLSCISIHDHLKNYPNENQYIFLSIIIFS